MKSNLIIIFLIMFSFFNNVHAKNGKLAYDFNFEGIEGNKLDLKEYKNKVILVVNVASRCGFTNQYKDLQSLWTKYQNKDLMIIGVPTNNFRQEPGTNKEIKDFCETNFGIDFPLTQKVNVLGKNAHPFYKWAKLSFGMSAIPKWNFHKIVINKKGEISNTFASVTNPSSTKFINFIEKELKN
jgi:glutathione peroxidase